MIVIKKRVSLEFLGDEYKEAYFIFKSIPAIEYESYQEKIKGLESNQQSSLSFMVQILKDYFIDGEFPNDSNQLAKVNKDDLDGLDADAVIGCFQVFTGQTQDPKVEKPLTNSSPTAE